MALTSRDVEAWAETLAASAQTGLSFTDNLYEQERYEEILKVAAEMKVAAGSGGNGYELSEMTSDLLFGHLRSEVGRGIPGYVTPKVSVGAIVVNEERKLLLIKRSDSGVWLYPTGWADVGYSAAEVVEKEVREETGIIVEVERLIAVLDGMQLGFTAIPMYSILFLCSVLGGELRPHPLEAMEVGWFALEELPQPLLSLNRRVPALAALLRGDDVPPYYDPPRRSR